MAIHENRTIVLALRIIQAVFAIIVLGTAAFVAHWWNSYYNDTASSPSQINFLIFCAVWSLLALVYLIIVPMMFAESVLHHKFAILAIEAVTMLFWFAGFIALAVFLPDRGCTGPVCGSARAACVFGAFSWVAWAVTTALAVMRVLHTRGTMSSRKGDPNLQVQEGV